MARIRTIKPDFFRHEELYQAEKESALPLRVAFAGLFTVADREGRFKWNPKHIKLDVLPWDDLDFELVLIELTDRGFIWKYTVDGKTYGWIPTFTNHQVINNKESRSTLPEPPRENTRLSRVDHASLMEGKEGKGRELIQVAEVVCEIFGKSYAHAEERLPAQANWYRTIDDQVQRLLQVWSYDVAVKQVRAYIKHCKKTQRKLIATDYKVAETLLSVDWIAINAPEPVPKDQKYSEAEHNRTLWTDDAWCKNYAKQIKSDPEFRKHFNLTTQ